MSSKNLDENVSFLLVEDDDDQAQLFLRVMQAQSFKGTIERVSDGHAALEYMYQRGEYKNAKRPDIVILDLNLPKLDGFEVLKTLKNDEKLKVIPVVVLTTSAAKSDKAQAYKNYANSYLVKPLDFAEFTHMTQEITDYWNTWNSPAPKLA